MMADSNSITIVPSSYDTISKSAPSADSIQCRPPSVFSFRQKRKDVLSRIHDIVFTPGFRSSCVAQDVNFCAAALAAAEFSNLLQTRNIEGHTALYWAIVNRRPDALSALAGFISQFSSVCTSDLRFAINSPKDEILRRSLGCLPDEIWVHERYERYNTKSVACIHIREFQKRLRITQNDVYGGSALVWGIKEGGISCSVFRSKALRHNYTLILWWKLTKGNLDVQPYVKI
ncbi:uncharacterized protein EDB91DRAFT_1348254 [Suillus paluster]|uniref:uncharacterized protein n=1 Tax=Suillus paluster TaxID=48578 RepID=UPI001B879417|nr:uncharacterized protein EDB91DRAFT_1348254 [Suillus paluster]KAG1735580.1 hypothetical protein EDB91DRAFT_1348254 [Suillus paluster]